MKDTKTLREKTGLTDRTIYNVKSEVKAVIDEVVEKKKMEMNPSEVPDETGSEKGSEVKSGTREGSKGSQKGALVVSDIDTSIYEKKVPQRTSPPHQTSPTSAHLISSSGTSSEKKRKKFGRESVEGGSARR